MGLRRNAGIPAVDCSDGAKGSICPLASGPGVELGDGQLDRRPNGSFRGAPVAVKGLAALMPLAGHCFIEPHLPANPLALATRLMLPC
jgi:hypothetical protein